MSEEQNVLTKEIAEQFLADEDSVDTSAYTRTDDAAAPLLATHRGELHLNGLKSPISLQVAESLGAHKGQVILDEPLYPEMEALLPTPLQPVSLGVTDPAAPRYKGVTKFKIEWDLNAETLENAGYDADWGNASVICDLATGQASDFKIRRDLVEKGLAIPHLDSGITIRAVFENDRSIVWRDQSGDIDIDVVDFEDYPYGEIVKATHARAAEFFDGTPTKFPFKIGKVSTSMQWNGSAIFKVFFYLGVSWTEGAVKFTYDFSTGTLLGINGYGGKCKSLNRNMKRRPFTLESCSANPERCVELIDDRWRKFWPCFRLAALRQKDAAAHEALRAEYLTRYAELEAVDKLIDDSLTMVLDRGNWKTVDENKETPWAYDSFARLHHEGKASASDPKYWDEVLDMGAIADIAEEVRKLVDQPSGPYASFREKE
jgi:hypothetical protein